MAETKALTATVRSGTGKGAARSVRREGRIPAVIYGGGDPAEPIELDYREINKLIYAGHFLTTIFEIDLGSSKQRVIPRDYQLDRVEDRPCTSTSCGSSRERPCGSMFRCISSIRIFVPVSKKAAV